MPEPTLTQRLLTRAVERIGGAPRPGQEEMARIIDDALDTSQHALIQAGTGTGKSLGYLVPLLAHLIEQPDFSAVVATATLALQTQLASKDVPTVKAALSDLDLMAPSWCVLKGSANYPCLLKIRDAPADPAERQFSLIDVESDEEVDADSGLGQQVMALRRWAEEQVDQGVIADRDDAPSHSPHAWAQVSVSGRECVGQSCPYVGECFVYAARERAAKSSLVVTNHALVAIEAGHGWSGLNPKALVIDEAHELQARVTTAQTDELSPQMVDRVVRMVSPMVTDLTKDDLTGAAERFAAAMDQASAGRVGPGGLLDATTDLRAAMRQAVTAVGHDAGNPKVEQVAAAVKHIHDICERVADQDQADVVWVSQRPQYGSQLVVAPLRVADAIRASILDHQPTVLTSATLKLGDTFTSLIHTVGLIGGEDETPYTAVDVGSPFDYPRQGICYVASHLPKPGRDGISDEALVEIADLVEAADGHTLGLFSSMKAAIRAAEFVRSCTDKEILLQGEGHLPELIARFVDTPQLSLFGTISLWQGVDAPGATCDVVIVDRIPFPRPDEPLTQARQEDISRHGGNGFMSVAAAHAGLMLAQGTGRLIRRTTDRGVVAILDPRLLTARYGRFLIQSMPPLWMTTDREVVMAALKRLNAEE
ncbi:MAG: ATP-dependent DNA helicase [Propionibacteriaceae bacterium]|jgi:ATP-dependent DNA helicase DinG|nr:ATP-dependent DNA helicase [Propionibacteriaceae bacterium]